MPSFRYRARSRASRPASDRRPPAAGLFKAAGRRLSVGGRDAAALQALGSGPWALGAPEADAARSRKPEARSL